MTSEENKNYPSNEINRRFAKQMSDILEEKGSSLSRAGKAVSLCRKDNHNLKVLIHSWEEEDKFLLELLRITQKSRKGGVLPSEFEPPCIHFEVINGEEGIMTTPYGRLPTLVASPDNKIYRVSNSYFFDLEGRAVKHEEIIDLTFGGSRPLEEISLGELVSKVDVSLDERRSRYTELKPGDYELIANTLQQIAEGEFVVS